jgi:asparagine synthase (glutamine-hydrolysing)
MCGIFSVLNNIYFPDSYINSQFQKGQNRGPEFSKLTNFLKVKFGFHRLAINGLNEKSNQPIIIDNIVLICNGEIFNYKKLYKDMNITSETDSDCEVIIHLYKKYGIEHTLQMLDGVFAFILLDNSLNNGITNRMYVARDTYGVCPLYYLKNKNDNQFFAFASELKCLSQMYNYYLQEKDEFPIVQQFKPSTYSVFTLSEKVNSSWNIEIENKSYIIPCFSYAILSHSNSNYRDTITHNISLHLTQAVEKRCITTERPVACLLSGGLDSSLITALVNDYYKKTYGDNYVLETYSIGLENSEDIKYARKVADYLGTKHTEIIVTEKEMFDAIPEVIYNIESYDTTTVRASIGNFLLGKYIASNSEAKVIFNGDGSDELCGGYIYMKHCPDIIEFDKETRRLLQDIHLFDVLRSDKCISSHGLEPRTPFLDRNFVNYYLSIPTEFKFDKMNNSQEKSLLRESFSIRNFENFQGKQLIPHEVLWRRKEAFSDGVSNKKRSLFDIIQDNIIQMLEDRNRSFDSRIESEKEYYKNTFNRYFPNLAHVVPYFWMPKYIEAKDPSARTLEIYNEA